MRDAYGVRLHEGSLAGLVPVLDVLILDVSRLDEVRCQLLPEDVHLRLGSNDCFIVVDTPAARAVQIHNTECELTNRRWLDGGASDGQGDLGTALA